MQAGCIWPKCYNFNDLRYLKKERIMDSPCKLWSGFFAEFRGEFIYTLIVKIDAILWAN